VPRRIELAARIAVFGVLALLGALGIGSLRGIYADGAWDLWANLSGVGLVDGTRIFAQWLAQGPIHLAIGSGVTDLDDLMFIYGLGPVLLPLLAWAAAFIVVFRDDLFWFFVAAFAVVYLNSGFVAIGQYSLMYGLAALAAAILVRPRLSIPLAVVLGLVAVIALRTYEAAAYLSPLLALLAVVTARRKPAARRWEQVLRYAVAGLFLVGAALAVIALIAPRDATNLATASDLLAPLTSDLQFVISFLIAAALLAAVLVLRGRWRAVTAALLALATLVLLIPALWAPPWMHYHARTITGIALVLLLGVPILLRVLGRPVSFGRTWPASAALLAVLVVPMAVHSIEYRGWLERFQLSIQDRSGIVDLTGSLAEYEAPTYAWPWTNPFLSLLLREDGSTAVLSSPGVAPADQDVPPALPARFHR
jgi:hypothetical protein